MAAQLQLDILTPNGPVELKSDGGQGGAVEVPGVELPGAEGELGILPGHVPFLGPIKPGVMRFRSGGRDQRVAVGRGFVEVSLDGRVSVLAGRAVPAEKIDLEDVRRQLAEVQKEIGQHKTLAVDDPRFERTVEERDWLEAQLRAAGH